MKRLSNLTKKKIIALKEEGYNNQAIAYKVGCSNTSVSNVLKDFMLGNLEYQGKIIELDKICGISQFIHRDRNLEIVGYSVMIMFFGLKRMEFEFKTEEGRKEFVDMLEEKLLWK